MKQYTFNCAFSVLLFGTIVFCGRGIDSDVRLTLFDKEDVAKYWLVKQLAHKYNHTDVFLNTINPLLASLKNSDLISYSEGMERKVKKIAYKNLTDDYAKDHGFAFPDDRSVSHVCLNLNIPDISFDKPVMLEPHPGKKIDMCYSHQMFKDLAIQQPHVFSLKPVTFDYSSDKLKPIRSVAFHYSSDESKPSRSGVNLMERIPQDRKRFVKLFRQHSFSNDGLSKKPCALTLFSKDDVIKYWLIKQLAISSDYRDIFLYRINPLLTFFKKPILTNHLEIAKMLTKMFCYRSVKDLEGIEYCWFGFDEAYSLEFDKALQQRKRLSEDKKKLKIQL